MGARLVYASGSSSSPESEQINTRVTLPAGIDIDRNLPAPTAPAPPPPVPPAARLAYAMETHGVLRTRMAPTPSEAQLAPPRSLISRETGQMVVKVAPYLAVAAVYAATSWVRWKKVRVPGGWVGAVPCVMGGGQALLQGSCLLAVL